MTQEGHRYRTFMYFHLKPVPFLLWGLLLCNVRCTEGSFLCLVRTNSSSIGKDDPKIYISLLVITIMTIDILVPPIPQPRSEKTKGNFSEGPIRNCFL
jgi:hypothetical protein